MKGKQVRLFMQIYLSLARECPGLIDWHDKYDIIMTRVLRALNLEIGQGTERVNICSTTSFHLDHAAIWLAYMVGGPNNGLVFYILEWHIGLIYASNSWFI